MNKFILLSLLLHRCILVGRNTIVGKLTDGHLMMTCLTKLVRQAIKEGEEVEITIE